ncbi:probable protein phosphatase 2C 51 isoform X1 [Salvia hispanica]|uniref:probable protein phosphatase 2C 51 isoform X1 n=1 Tax=Salvia hispanica TaxID=49212 RepID=UPI0020092575|nr:probable protein phosphatase 2C 51 isoform X1 [Salvia hispanica]XP_047954840.1 probable protein phosphatase 2C 51 isoform X1 [Salvia hispanica]
MRLMMKWVAILTWLLCTAAAYAKKNDGIGMSFSLACMMAYEEGGVSGVLNSPECPWLSFPSSLHSSNSNNHCHFATLQGRRDYQEDRLLCNLHLHLPFSHVAGEEGVPSIGVAAIFDGHGGREASEMASAMLSPYLLINVAFMASKRVLPSNDEYNKTQCSLQRAQAVIDHDTLRSVLEEALLRTIQDIDSEFSKQALDKGYVSGSTATVALLFEGQLLVANVGDSKALLCSKHGDSSKQVYVEELTRDHHPDREDEKTRIEAAGGFITRYGVPRVNGILALSRAIGDVYFKRFGVTAEAEVTSWKAFTSENSYLVVASDGVFETLTPKDVCRLLHNKGSSSLPEQIIRRAFETGSMDNLSAIVISHLVSCCGRESTESIITSTSFA